MIEIRHLLLIIDAYREATGVEDTTVSNRVFADSKKITAMRAGADITLGRFNEALRWFSQHWPEGAEWPSEIPLPVFSPSQEQVA
jgi:hypothetical protein